MYQHRTIATGAIAALFLALASASLGAGAGRLTVEQPIFDAGVIAKGDEVSHEFEIHNNGTDVLYIREVQPACGCTVARFDPEIPPGGTGTVTVVLDTTNFEGPISKPVTVLSSDATNPSVRLTIKAQVRPLVAVIPGWARFQHVVGEEEKRVTQKLWTTDGEPLQILRVESPLPFVEASYRRAMDDELDTQGPPTQWLLTATLGTDAPEGPVVGNIVVTTNHPRRPSIEIPLTGYVKPLISIQPATVDFGRFQRPQAVRKSVVLTNNGPTDFEITSVESDLPGLESEIKERDKGRQFQILVTLGGVETAGPIETTLRVYTTDERLLEITVKGIAL